MDIHNASKREKKAAELEAKLLSSLHHPNIVGYKDSFQGLDGFLYIAMSFCEGRGRIRVKVASTFANELFRYRINFSIRILLRLSVKSFARIKIITFDDGKKNSRLSIALHFILYRIVSPLGGDLYGRLKNQNGQLLEERQLVEWFVRQFHDIERDALNIMNKNN